mmetsp:Transcript_26815/g.69469  ORF Transcript_26815/g.69469 Transcript_26815/m.69469 type:complete len:241 (+) Transcript_26815:377-1099(+)
MFAVPTCCWPSITGGCSQDPPPSPGRLRTHSLLRALPRGGAPAGLPSHRRQRRAGRPVPLLQVLFLYSLAAEPVCGFCLVHVAGAAAAAVPAGAQDQPPACGHARRGHCVPGLGGGWHEGRGGRQGAVDCQHLVWGFSDVPGPHHRRRVPPPRLEGRHLRQARRRAAHGQPPHLREDLQPGHRPGSDHLCGPGPGQVPPGLHRRSGGIQGGRGAQGLRGKVRGSVQDPGCGEHRCWDQLE